MYKYLVEQLKKIIWNDLKLFLVLLGEYINKVILNFQV